MSYPFVAAPDHWARGGAPIRAIVIHMAEGGGTVSWLTRPDGNSSHYVVEYSGRVVQMVREDRAAGSINPTLIREDDDPPYDFGGVTVRYGATAARKALGAWSQDPNAAVIAIETEGFAKSGPNIDQRRALSRLVDDIRGRHGPLHALGHRDFQRYKACPGHLIPWVDYGGHGAPEDEMIPAPITDETEHTVTAAQGHAWRDLDAKTILRQNVSALGPRPSPFGTAQHRAIYATLNGVRRIVLISPVTSVPVDKADCQPIVDAAIAADRLKARVTYD